MAPVPALRQGQLWRRRLYLPAYSIADAARYAHTAPQTVAYWHYRGGRLGPVLSERERGSPLSYLQLVEVAFVATFRHLGVSLQRIRKAREYLAQVFQSEYPFTERRLLTEGKHILFHLHEIEQDADIGHLVLADAGGQLAWEDLVADRFAEFDYEEDLAIRWHVAGRENAITIDPRVSFGAPTVRGIATWAIKGRFLAGESVEDIKEDFGLEEDDIRQALEFEGIKVAA